MASRDEIIEFCDRLLEITAFEDYGPNGMQVPGSAEVSKVVSGVSASLELLERSAAAGAQLVIVHHGLFWGGAPAPLSEQMAARLRVSLGANLTVAGYHLPLDAHEEIGNNVLLCRTLGFEPDRTTFAEAGGRHIGAVGRDKGGVSIAELTTRLAAVSGREPLVFDAGPERIRSIGVVTGSGSRQIGEAAGLGLDALVTGEPSEPAMADARECGIHFLAGGHHATETLGVRRLGELVGERFGVEHEFIDVPNPI
jgi:dinuclear metal center YbgI/SA1388 family protein